MNRKLIRPNLGEIKEKMGRNARLRNVDSLPSGGSNGDVLIQTNGNSNSNGTTLPQGTSSSRRKIAPPEQTNAESFYYLKQMQSKTPMVIVLQDGEKIRGGIEWYDKHCLKINCQRGPNILLPKHNIKYIYKQEEEPRVRRTRGGSAKKEEVSAESQGLMSTFLTEP
ncbi:MAG: RNA chaperone Hfq [Holophagaceae bacterium]|nr:RNA chaperone Hfq [Holophagaceae bacterium]